MDTITATTTVTTTTVYTLPDGRTLTVREHKHLRPRRFTPYAGCAAGYAFAPRRDANGGLLLNPELGVQYALRCGVHLFFAAGYELQRLERLRKYEGCWFSAEFAEQLSHGTLLLKVGVLF